jgi:hypothetical protein
MCFHLFELTLLLNYNEFDVGQNEYFNKKYIINTKYSFLSTVLLNYQNMILSNNSGFVKQKYVNYSGIYTTFLYFL